MLIKIQPSTERFKTIIDNKSKQQKSLPSFGMKFHKNMYSQKFEKSSTVIDTLLDALSYVKEFKDKVFVIKVGGSIMKNENESRLSNVLQNIATIKQLGLSPLVVHGGGPAINAILAKQKIEPHFVNGKRFTDDKTLAVVTSVLPQIGDKMSSVMQGFGVKAKSLFGADILEASKKLEATEQGSLDIGWVGRIDNVDINPIQKMLKKGIVPIISPIGKGAGEQKFNINADDAALEIAKSLNADRLVYITDVDGISCNKDGAKRLISQITPREIQDLIDKKDITGGMIPKAASSAEAIKSGKINKVQIINGGVKNALLAELFTKAGIGTIIKS